MKTRFFFLSALAVAAIAFTGCDKNAIEIATTKGIPFEFTATSEITKTTNDGAHTNWAADDQVNLFHAEASTDSYVSDGAFTAASAGASTTFSGTLASELTADNYDWYAIYPYTKQISTPANTSSGWVTLGSAASGKQTQTVNSSMAHIAGANYPVAGKVLNVAKETSPVIAMSHLTSLIAVKVTNGTEDPITVSQISFTGTEDIVGTYYINFVSSPVVYTGSGAGYVSDTATLQVTSDTPIAKDASATFYLAVKPFTAPKDGTITLAVTADNGEQIIDKVLASDFTFAAGQKNTLNFTYTKEAVAEVWKLTDLASITSSDVFVIVGNNGANYAMTNDNSTTSAPSAYAVSVVTGGGITKLSANPVDKIKWHLTKDGSNYTFYPGTSGTSTWLYCTATNNGVRVGTNANKVFTLTDSYLKHTGTSRYVGIYNSSDWRCYTSINNNIKDQEFTFYVLQ